MKLIKFTEFNGHEVTIRVDQIALVQKGDRSRVHDNGGLRTTQGEWVSFRDMYTAERIEKELADA